MKVGIFQEPSSGFGGSELVAAVMADALRGEHEVEIVHHRPNFTVAQLETFFALDLKGVRGRFVAPPDRNPIYSGRYLPGCRRYWRRWNAEVSEPYDLFVANVHGVPPQCHAPHGVLNVLFPGFDRTRSWPWAAPSRSALNRLADPIRRSIYEAGWRERMASYRQKLSISKYTAEWTQRYWGFGSEILYPPVLTDSGDATKCDAIVNLARFTAEKQQAELLATFIGEIAPRAPGWELVFVGGLSDEGADQAYFARLRAVAAGHPVRFIPNATRDEVRAELGRARIYWHAMGLDVDPGSPAKVEHFGIAPVEAMAAGCVPVVFAAGGPAEVVLDGSCGYACGSLGQMTERIIGLTRDARGRDALSAAARVRSQEFSVARFKERFRGYLRPLLGARVGATT